MDNKYYTFEKLADLIIDKLDYNRETVISITGPSCVGKSTLADKLAERIQSIITIQVIRVDNYLKNRYKGKTKFRNNSDSILAPDVFDWELLKYHIENLKQGRKVCHNTYIRGKGWEQMNYLCPGKIIILEGLFLDSVQAFNFIDADLLIEMSANDELIRKLRLQRDKYYRENFKNFHRTELESMEEIDSTIIANRMYKREIKKNGYLKILVNNNCLIEIVKEVRNEKTETNKNITVYYKGELQSENRK